MIISNLYEYEQAKRAMEVDPLITGWEDNESRVYLPIELRVEIQDAIFHSKTRGGQMSKFYKWCWDNMPHICEETMMTLYSYRAEFISHILSRGAHYEKSVDPRNINMLILPAHNQWEVATRNESMRIYWKNQTTIIKLNREYLSLQPKNLK